MTSMRFGQVYPDTVRTSVSAEGNDPVIGSYDVEVRKVSGDTFVASFVAKDGSNGINVYLNQLDGVDKITLNGRVSEDFKLGGFYDGLIQDAKELKSFINTNVHQFDQFKKPADSSKSGGNPWNGDTW